MIQVSLAVGMSQKFQRFKLSTILERAEYVPKEQDTAPTEIIIIQSAPWKKKNHISNGSEK